MIKWLHDANLHATFYYDYTHFLQSVFIYEIKKINRCLTRFISERFGTLSRWGGNDDQVQGYKIN